ncbi:N-formyl peptide receptor 3-like [Leptodactylus fuscus]
MPLTSTLSCLLRLDLYYQNIFQKISFTLHIITFVLGIIGNGLVIWIAGFRMKKTIGAVWFLYLAIADFLFCMFLPLHIVDELYSFSDLDVNPICILYIFLFTINMSASVLILTAMSIDRCVSVMWPFWAKVHRTPRLVKIIAVNIWVLSLPFTVLILRINNWCKTQLQDDDYRDLQNMVKTTRLIRLLLMFVIPFLIILTSYVIIFLKLRKSKRPRRSQRPYRITIAIVLCFFICYFPFYVWPVTPMYYDGDYIVSDTLDIIAISLASFNSCINPIIYVLMSQDLRLSFLTSIPARIERALGEHPEDLSREPEDSN